MLQAVFPLGLEQGVDVAICDFALEEVVGWVFGGYEGGFAAMGGVRVEDYLRRGEGFSMVFFFGYGE